MSTSSTQNPFTLYDPEAHELQDLVGAIVASGSQISVDEESIVLKYGSTTAGSSLSFYDGSLSDLKIGPGLLLTSGDGAPPLQNSESAYTQTFNENFTQDSNGLSAGYTVDEDLVDVAENAFSGAGNLTDASILSFDIEVTDPEVKSVFFTFSFGSEEYPNYIDSSYVDTAAVLVNGTNYALFNGDLEQPLSVISKNVAMGNFKNNHGEYEPVVPAKFSEAVVENVQYPIEYNAISEPLTVNAPVNQGINTVTIGVSDTGDKSLDSALFVSSLATAKGQLSEGAGIFSSGEGYIPLVTMGVDSSDIITQSGDGFMNPFGDSLVDLPFEVDESGAFVFGKTGMDGQYIAGSQKDLVDAKFDFSVKEIQNVDFDIDAQTKYNFVDVESDYGSQKFVYVQKMIFDDFGAAMDTWEGSDTWNTFSLLNVAFGQDPTSKMFTEWLLKSEDTEDTTELAGMMIDEYAPEGFTTENLVSYLYQTLTGSTLKDVEGQITFLKGMGLDSNAEIFGFVAENYSNMSAIDGKFVPLDLDVLSDSPEDPEPEPVPEELPEEEMLVSGVPDAGNDLTL